MFVGEPALVAHAQHQQRLGLEQIGGNGNQFPFLNRGTSPPPFAGAAADCEVTVHRIFKFSNHQIITSIYQHINTCHLSPLAASWRKV